MCECLTVHEIVHWEPPQVEAKQRIPAAMKGHSFFSSFDLYQYIAITDDRTCKNCLIFDKMIVGGDMIRAYYPYLEIISPNQLLPHVHPNCRCTILRVTDLADYITYSEPVPDFPSHKYTEPAKVNEKPDYVKGAVRSVSLDDLGIELAEKAKREKPT